MDRDTFYYPRVLQVLSKLVLDTPRHEAAAASLFSQGSQQHKILLVGLHVPSQGTFGVLWAQGEAPMLSPHPAQAQSSWDVTGLPFKMLLVQTVGNWG